MNDSKLVYLSVAELFPHPDNPRKDLGDLTELMDSIKSNGIMQNLTVVEREAGGYTVIIGHRRTAAAKAAGLTELPCVIVAMTPQEQVATMLLENMQRSDLTAYEQAQGFQMMMDLGETVDTIAQKTGFSKTTVNRRLKIAELDQEALKKVSTERQISLGDLDRLSQIDELAERNMLLDDIGTTNFNMRFERIIKRQALKKIMPDVKNAIRQLGATKVMQTQVYGNDYEKISDILLAKDWENGMDLVPARYKEVKLFYTLDEDYGQLRIYEKKKKASPAKRPQSEIDREKYIEDTRRQLDELSDAAEKLRSGFVNDLKLTTANRDRMITGFVNVIALSYLFWSNSPDKSILCERMGWEWDYVKADECRDRFLQELAVNGTQYIPLMIYQSFALNDSKHFYTEYKREFPRWQKNIRLDLAYDWLSSLGYEMSDDERMMRDGTHPLFIDKDKKDDPN